MSQTKDITGTSTQGVNEADIAFAYDAAFECVAAIRSFCKAAAEEDDYANYRRDYRPYVARLYLALRNGWQPIAEVWPQLVEMYSRTKIVWEPEYTMIDRVMMMPIYDSCADFPAVSMWLLAHECFWRSLRGARQLATATRAWFNWDEEYVPDLRDYGWGDSSVWANMSGERSIYLAACGDVVGKMSDVLPPTLSRRASRARAFRIKPGTLLSPEDVPSEHEPLQLLRDLFSRVTSDLVSRWNKLKGSLRPVVQSSDTRKSLTERLEDNNMNFYDDDDLSVYLPPVESAICHADWYAVKPKLFYELYQFDESQSVTAKAATVEKLQSLADDLADAGDRIIHLWQKTCASIRSKQVPEGGIEPGDGVGTTDRPQNDLEVASPEQNNSVVPNDPISLEQAAVLVHRRLRTLYNRKKDRPSPAIPDSGSQKAVFSYATLRPWLLKQWPDRLYRLPENYDQAKKLFAEPDSPE